MIKQHQWAIPSTETGIRLDKWLAAPERLASRKRAFTALERGQVFVNEQEQCAADAGRKLQAGDKVRLWLDRPGSAQRRSYVSQSAHNTGKRVGALHILYEDQSLIVLNKPAGLLSVPLPREDEPSLQAQVRQHLKSQHKRQTLVVHRIDRDTSGPVVFAKDFKTQQKLKDQFAARQPERVYWAFVYGVPVAAQGEWRDLLVWDDEALRQRQPRAADAVTHEAISRYRVVEAFAEAALLEVTLVTGKRNQIRMQAALRGHQLIGEKKYVSQPAPRRLIEFPRQALHALRLGLRHPVDGRALTFEAPLPADLQQLRQKLQRG
jgi:23S rRNA pseudouridine1911/1915/1917 synthase